MWAPWRVNVGVSSAWRPSGERVRTVSELAACEHEATAARSSSSWGGARSSSVHPSTTLLPLKRQGPAMPRTSDHQKALRFVKEKLELSAMLESSSSDDDSEMSKSESNDDLKHTDSDSDLEWLLT
ncbi:unnamed protein product [Calypogeia fissa]